MSLNILDGVLHRFDLFRILVRNLDAESFLNAITSSIVSRESAPVVNKRCASCHLGLVTPS